MIDVAVAPAAIEITVQRKEFVEALKRARETVSGRGVVPLYQCFAFMDDKLYSYDGAAGTITDCPLNGMNFAIQAEKFYKLISSLFDTIHFRLEGSNLHISSGSNKTVLQTIPTRGFPDIMPGETEILYNGTDFVDALREVEFTIGKNVLKPQFLGVAFVNDGVYTVDGGKRVSRYRLVNSVAKRVVLTDTSVKHLIKLGQPTYVFHTKDGNVVGAFYESTKTIYTSNTQVDKFPYEAVERVLAAHGAEFLAELPEEFRSAIERVQLLTAGEDSDVILEHDGNSKLTVKTNTADLGNATDSVLFPYSRPFKFAVDPTYLLRALDKTRRINLENIVTQPNPVYVRFETDKLTHNCALMVLKE